MPENTKDPLTDQPTDQNSKPMNSDKPEQNVTQPESGFAKFWRRVRQMGITGMVTRVGTSIITILVVFLFVFALGRFYINNVQTSPTSISNDQTTEAIPTDQNGTTTNVEDVVLPEYAQPDTAFFYGTNGISRAAQPQTIIPSRPRAEISTYQVEMGDSVFSIAEKFDLEPETILWGNYDTLKDNPRFLEIGQQLVILPVNGIYYRYNAGESLTSIAESFEVTVDAILEYPGNNLDPYDTNPEEPAIADGTWLIIPGGKREIQDWGPPAISRTNPASASYYGSGYCGEIYEGPVGDGVFVWPTSSTYLSGYHYSPGIHEAIDIGGVEGQAVWAADSGVVVFSGWSEYGYGNMVVIDHGNGWQTAYAHLQYASVSCGQGVYRGNNIGALGNTGNSTGAHLHFEMRNSSFGRVNPMDYLIQ